MHDGAEVGQEFVTFPVYALLVVEERLREQEAAGVRMPEGMELDELALRILIVAAQKQPASR
jgi:hypothetical protein